MKATVIPTDSAQYFSTDHLASNLKIRAMRGASMTLIAQVFSFAVQTVGTIILARILTPDDFGLIAMVLTMSLLLQNFGLNGFTEAVIQQKEINHRQISTLFWIGVALSVFLSVFFIVSIPVIVWFYREPRLKLIIIVISSSIAITGFSIQHLALLKRGMEFRKIAVNDMTAGVMSTIIPIAMAWSGCGYWSLVAKWIISPLFTTIGAWLLCGWRPSPPSRGTGVRRMFRFAMQTYGNFFMSYFRRNLDKILIGRFYGGLALGLYDRAYQLSSMIPSQIVSPLSSVAISAFSKLSGDKVKYRDSYLKLLSLIGFIGVPLSAALTLISNDVIFVLLGPKWHDAVKIFFAFGLSIGVVMIYITHGWLHLSLGTPDRWFKWGIVELFVTLICFMVGLRFGAFGVAIAFSASFYILVGPALWYAGKPIDLSILSVVSCLWKYYVSAFASGLSCWVLIYFHQGASVVFMDANIVLRMAISVLLCLLLYLIFVIALHRSPKPIVQFISTLREIVRR